MGKTGLGAIVCKTAHVRFRTRKRVHTRLHSKDRTQRLTRRNRGCFGWGRYLYPLTVLRDPETLRGQVSERQTLPLLGLGPVYSRRTQRALGTAMRLCVSLFRGVAAPLGYAASSAIWRCCFFSLCVRYFLHVRGKGGITTLGVLYMSSKRRTAACQND